jgi:hypothetical protein
VIQSVKATGFAAIVYQPLIETDMRGLQREFRDDCAALHFASLRDWEEGRESVE